MKKFIIAILIIFGIGFGIYQIGNIISSETNTPNPVVQVTKKAPDLSLEQTLTSVIINVYANDNYSLVEVQLEILDANLNILGDYTLQGTNYRKGNTYSLEKKLSFNQLLNASKIQYRCSNYK